MQTNPNQMYALLESLDLPTGKIDVVLDTDTYNEIDDQFALAYALISPERINLQAVYAAPFHNERSNGPENGMLKSYDEILRVLARVGKSSEGYAYKGSRKWFDPASPTTSDAVDDLISRARATTQPLFVVAIGACTNIANALVLAPDIMDKIVIVWLGGNPVDWHYPNEFNMMQDPNASRALLGSGAALLRVPCLNVAQHLNTTLAEMDRFVNGTGPLGDYLYEIFDGFYTDHFAKSKVLWDVACIGWLINPKWLPSEMRPSPVLTDDLKLIDAPNRPLIRDANGCDRDAIFGDLFRKLLV